LKWRILQPANDLHSPLLWQLQADLLRRRPRRRRDKNTGSRPRHSHTEVAKMPQDFRHFRITLTDHRLEVIAPAVFRQRADFERRGITGQLRRSE
jgi:hypothetical protein